MEDKNRLQSKRSFRASRSVFSSHPPSLWIRGEKPAALSQSNCHMPQSGLTNAWNFGSDTNNRDNRGRMNFPKPGSANDIQKKNSLVSLHLSPVTIQKTAFGALAGKHNRASGQSEDSESMPELAGNLCGLTPRAESVGSYGGQPCCTLRRAKITIETRFPR